ncbi:MAG TPA: HIT domain-containing protein [Candidatus Woesebacteria bacterium]|nr:HIT domain-containing protein [Candidatus Woesebacteria bacterium]
MNDCIFCKIVKGEIPCHKIYEDDNFLAFLDINPVSVGHTLLIPKNHYRWVYDIPNFGDFFNTAQKLALTIKNSPLNPEFISFLTMGNEVPHAHVHIIPRSQNDPIQPVLSSIPHLKLSEEKFLETKELLKSK